MNQDDIAGELLERYYSDADRLVHRGVASALDVDLGMRLGAGYPAGPFEARGSAPARFQRLARTRNRPGLQSASSGPGHMASGIAEAVARAGSAVTVSAAARHPSIARGQRSPRISTARSSRGRLSVQDAAAIVDRIDFVPSIGDIPDDAEVIIEAVAEDLAVKQRRARAGRPAVLVPSSRPGDEHELLSRRRRHERRVDSSDGPSRCTSSIPRQ